MSINSYGTFDTVASSYEQRAFIKQKVQQLRDKIADVHAKITALGIDPSLKKEEQNLLLIKSRVIHLRIS